MLSGRFAERFAWAPISAVPNLLWPLGLGLLLAVILGWNLRRIGPRLSAWLPAGDLWWPFAASSRRLRRLGSALQRTLAFLQAAWVDWWVARERDGLKGLDALTHTERWLRRQLALLMLVVALGLATILVFSAGSTPIWP